jgi:hypothetical protein
LRASSSLERKAVTDALTMRQRCAGQMIMEELVLIHQNSRPRNAVARFFGGSPLTPESRALFLDAKAEIAVGALLDQLPAGWSVIHSAPAGAGEPGIDHVVLGPGGLFTIASKLHPNQKIWVAHRMLLADGLTRDHIPAAEADALRVTGILKTRMPLPAPVRPVVAIVDARSITIRERSDIHVIDAWDLRRWLTSLPTILAESELRRTRDILDDPQVWDAEPRPVPASESAAASLRVDRLLADFTAIDDAMRSARTRRKAWKLAAWTVGIITPIAAFPYLVDAIRALPGL